jgi:AcrR family transcriptional regulator
MRFTCVSKPGRRHCNGRRPTWQESTPVKYTRATADQPPAAGRGVAGARRAAERRSAEEAARASGAPPVRDPAPGLPPTARRILAAAQRVLVRDGFRNLTFQAIGAEAGENSALTRYYFGSKAGLIEALVDAVVYQGSEDLRRQLLAAGPGRERRRVLLAVQRGWVADPREYRSFYAIVSHVLYDPALREKYRALFDWYCELEAWALAGPGTDDKALRPLAALIVAATDGLALQHQADPSFDPGPAYDVLAEMVTARLAGEERRA